MMASVSSDGRFNAKLIKFYHQYYLLIESSDTEILLTGDSLIAGLKSKRMFYRQSWS